MTLTNICAETLEWAQLERQVSTDEGAEGVPSYSLNKTHTHWLLFELLVRSHIFAHLLIITVPVTVGDK